MKKGIFLIHGFMENAKVTYEFLFDKLDEYQDIQYVGVDLQGHSEKEDINTFDHKKCLKEVVKEYIEFKEKYEEIIIIGFSMGGVIASYLASKFKCDKLILIAPSFKYVQRTKLGFDMFDLLSKKHISRIRKNIDKRYKEKDILQLIKSKFRDEDTVFSTIFSDKRNEITITPFKEFMFLVEKLKLDIDIRKIPTRIYIGENDELVPLSSVLYIFNKIKCDDRRLIIFPKSYHRILKSSVKDELIKEIIEFINRC